MKNLKKKIEALRDAVEKRILDREEVFEKRRETWQESAKGEAHEDETDKLREMFDTLAEWVEEIEELENN